MERGIVNLASAHHPNGALGLIPRGQVDRIDALRLLAYLAEHKSFSAAAKLSRVKQSTASKWIANLEAELGTPLVLRTTRQVRMTDVGRRVLEHARGLLEAFDRMAGEIQAERSEPAGRVRLSAPTVFGSLFVVPAVATLLARHREVHVELVLGDRYVNLVEEGFDLAIRVGVPTDTSARGAKLADSRRILVATRRYLDEHGVPTTPKDLERHECLVHGEASASMIWRFAGKTGREAPISVRGRFSANNSEVVLRLAKSGLGIALLADWLAQPEVDRGTLVPLLENFTTPPAPIYALTPSGRLSSPAVRALIAEIEIRTKAPRSA